MYVTHRFDWNANVSFLPFSAFDSVEDKQRVATLTHIPRFLPEITIGAHDYDQKYYAYKSVCTHVTLAAWNRTALSWCFDICREITFRPLRFRVIKD